MVVTNVVCNAPCVVREDNCFDILQTSYIIICVLTSFSIDLSLTRISVNKK